MSIGVPELMRETRNYFPAAVLDGSWSLSGGQLSPTAGLHEGAWIALTGAQHSNGVYQLGKNCTIPAAADETWSGRVWVLSPPSDFLALADQIAAWCTDHQDPALTHESFGAYSRTMASGGTAWQAAFAPALIPYRRMYTEVKL